MSLIDARKRFETRRTEARNKKPRGDVLTDRLAPVTDITPRAAKARDDDTFNRMVEDMSGDAETLHRRSTWLLRYASRVAQRLRKKRPKKD